MNGEYSASLELVFSFLTVRELCTVCASVCKLWSEVIYKSSSWENITLRYLLPRIQTVFNVKVDPETGGKAIISMGSRDHPDFDTCVRSFCSRMYPMINTLHLPPRDFARKVFRSCPALKRLYVDSHYDLYLENLMEVFPKDQILSYKVKGRIRGRHSTDRPSDLISRFLSHFTTLEEFTISCATDADVNLLSPNMKTLKLSSTESISVEGLLNLVRICPNLEYLKVSTENKTRDQINIDKFIMALSSLPRLRDLGIVGYNVSTDAWTYFSNAKKETITSIELPELPGGYALIDICKTLTSISKLNLKHAVVPFSSTETAAKYLTNLEELYASDYDLMFAGEDIWGSKLKVLNLGYATVSDECFIKIIDMTYKTLTHLKFSMAGLLASTFHYAASKFRNLIVLNLDLFNPEFAPSCYDPEARKAVLDLVRNNFSTLEDFTLSFGGEMFDDEVEELMKACPGMKYRRDYVYEEVVE